MPFGARHRRAAGTALLARAVNLDDALRRSEAARRRHFLDEGFDVRTEELERTMAGLADQMEVTGLTVRMLEPESPFAEVDLAGNARIDHPLQRAIHRCTADAVIVAPNEIDEIVGAEMPFLPQEDVDNLLPLAGALATGRFQPTEIWKSCQR